MINKLKTLSQGQLTESVLDKMASTFSALVKVADFSAAPAGTEKIDRNAEEIEHRGRTAEDSGAVKLGGLVYNIQLILPESRDAAVYDALFQSLMRHLR